MPSIFCAQTRRCSRRRSGLRARKRPAGILGRARHLTGCRCAAAPLTYATHSHRGLIEGGVGGWAGANDSYATDVYSYVFAAGPYQEDPLTSLDLRRARDTTSDGNAGYGTDRRNLYSLLCGSECFELAVAGQLSELTLLEVGYLRSLQVQYAPSRSLALSVVPRVLLPTAHSGQVGSQLTCFACSCPRFTGAAERNA